MNTQRKVDIVMNLMYNFVLAVLLTVAAEIINAGGVTWPALGIETVVSYVLEMIIAIWLPFTRWGQQFAIKRAQPGSRKFRLLCALITAIPFATLMSLAMSFFSVVVSLHLPLFVWMIAWLKIWILFIAIAWICSCLLVPFFIE